MSRCSSEEPILSIRPHVEDLNKNPIELKMVKMGIFDETKLLPLHLLGSEIYLFIFLKKSHLLSKTAFI